MPLPSLHHLHPSSRQLPVPLSRQLPLPLPRQLSPPLLQFDPAQTPPPLTLPWPAPPPH